MSDSTDSSGSTPSLAATVDKYNTYGLATQGYVWAAISSVSGDWGKGYVKSVNGVFPDTNNNVSVESISSTDYSGELSRINSDGSMVICGENGHRVLTDRDKDIIQTTISAVSGNLHSEIDGINSLIPDGASSSNKLADRAYVEEQITSRSSSYRGSWTHYSDIPENAELYPADLEGSRIPKTGDNLIVRDDENLVGTWRYVYNGVWTENGKSGWKSDYRITDVAFTDVQWKAINSGITEETLADIESASGGWNSAESTVTELSSQWEGASNEVYETSAKYRSLYKDYVGNKDRWTEAYSALSSTSGEWDRAATYVEETSSRNGSLYTTVSSLSGRWKDATTEIESTSASNRSVFSTVGALSSEWNRVAESFDLSSVKWNSVYTSVKESSAKWNESEGSTKKYTDMMATSALTTAEEYSDIGIKEAIDAYEIYASFVASSALSSAKEYTDISISAESKRIDSVYSTVEGTSALWNKTSDSLSELSGNYNDFKGEIETSRRHWDNAYTTVASHSAIWDESSGSTKKYTDMMATSALTSAERYADSAAESAVTEADRHADTKIENIYETFCDYARFTAASSLSAAGLYSEFTSASSLSSAKEYADELSVSTLESACIYSSFVSASALSSSEEYTDKKAENAVRDANIYSTFIATSALSTANEYSDIVTESAYASSTVYAAFTAASALSSAAIYTDDASATLRTYTDSMAFSALTSANTYTDFVSSSLNITLTVTIPFSSTDGIDEVAEYYEQNRYPNNGDTIIIRKQLFEGATDKFRYTSYTYDRPQWRQMDGEHSVDDVFFTDNLTTTFDIGKEKIDPEIGYKILDTKGKSINGFFKDVFIEEHDPAVTLPSIGTVSVTGVGSYESGTIVVPEFSFTTVNGSYEYGPVSESEFDGFTASINRQVINVVNGSAFTPITLTDSMSTYSDYRRMQIIGHYTDDTVVPLNNLGMECENSRITAGYTEAVYSTECLMSYRQSFFEARTEHTNLAMLSSLFVRQLANKTGCYPAEDSEIVIDYPIGVKNITFAVPAEAAENVQVIDKNLFGMNISSSFNTATINVKDAAENNAIPYVVFWKNSADANDEENTYTVKFKE